MARNTGEYTSRYDLDEPDERNEWKKESNVARLFAAEMEEKHPALFRELQEAANGDIDHRKTVLDKRRPQPDQVHQRGRVHLDQDTEP